VAYSVSLKPFDGPLDLLITLIAKARIDIADIFVSQITEQYLEYMAGIDELDMDSASEFLQMASTLIEIKSRSLLPRPPRIEEEGGMTPEEALIAQLNEYKRIKEASIEIAKLERAATSLIKKLPEEYALPPQEIELTGMTLDRLTRAFHRILMRMQSQAAIETPRRNIRRDQYTIADCELRILAKLRVGKAAFNELFTGARDKDELITMFLATLELVKRARVVISQDTAFGEIYLMVNRAAEPLMSINGNDEEERF
jgi:segregation and condensation protein A